MGVGQQNNIYELEGTLETVWMRHPTIRRVGCLSTQGHMCQTQVSGSWHFSIIVSPGEHKPC